MTELELLLKEEVSKAVQQLYGEKITSESVQAQKTRKEFSGDITIVVFPYLAFSKKSPELTGNEIGAFIKSNCALVEDFNTIKGFLNVSFNKNYWISKLNDIIKSGEDFGYIKAEDSSPLVMIEYSSPNTNKPLHLGHIRNNLLGFSLSEIMKANGNKVVKTNIVNDRGIHICKSMLAWQKWGEGITPEKAGKKGDHLVGDFYVRFDKEYKEELKSLIEKGMSEEEAVKNSSLMEEARELLRKWEAKDPEVYRLWKTMNNWVYEGFDVTYKALGVNFDKIYYESDTFSVGKEMVMEGLKKGIFYQRDDSSVWADLTGDGLDEKLLLRSDSTSVYMTQDIGTAKMRFDDFSINKMIYVVGNEQNYHFQVLSILLDKLGFSWGKDLVHFSYGMVELPQGKMKSREGTVVDADDLVTDMIHTAKEKSLELGKLEGLSSDEADEVYRRIALAALKYFILKVDPRKTMLFNPAESIDFNGNTGPFIQYTYARIQSVIRKANTLNIDVPASIKSELIASEKEISLIQKIGSLPQIVKDAAINYSPAIIANFCYDLVKEYNQFYHDSPILSESNEDIRSFRLALSAQAAKAVRNGMKLLGIEMVDRM